MKAPFERTTCACAACIECCKRPAHLIPDDVTTLQERFGAEFPALFRRSKGATVARVEENGEIKVWQIPTITPKVASNGRCVFLTADQRCSIHEVAPFGCAYFDTHHADEGRSAWGLQRIMEDRSYAATRAMLSADGAPGSQEQAALTVAWEGTAYAVRFSRYRADNSVAIWLADANGEPVAKATVYLEHHELPKHEVWLKGWSENAGLPDALESSGIIQRTGRACTSKFVVAEHARLTDRAIAELVRQEAEQ